MREWLPAGRIDLARRPRLPASVAVRQSGRFPLILPSPPNAIRTLVKSVCWRPDVRLAKSRIVSPVIRGDLVPASPARSGQTR